MKQERINIAELLKDCPKGMELDCISYNGVATLGGVTNNIYYPISINVSCNNENICVILTEYGQTAPTMFNKCIIFPKGKTTWEGFQRPFKDGDVVTYKLRGSLVAFIYKERINTMRVKSHFALYAKNMGFCVDSEIALKEEEIVFATEEEKESLFKAIKDYGYRWNKETKTLEKLVESKEDTDDRVVMSGICFDRENYADEVELHLGNYEIEIRDGKTYAVFKSKTKTLEKLITPKFKVGDWLQYRAAKPFFVEEITEQGYVNGNSCLPFEWENEIHIWTIQDARAGDVLVHNSFSFIFMGIKNGIVKGICTELGDTILNFGNSECDNDYCPATKEQRDLLFRKMKESGYEWDAEKKELRKIEQKPAWSEEDINALNRISAILVDASEVKNWWKEYRLIEKDEMIRLTDFLKSFKDRCTWKPSDEQIIALRWVLNNVPYNKHKEEISGLLDQIKEL